MDQNRDFHRETVLSPRLRFPASSWQAQRDENINEHVHPTTEGVDTVKHAEVNVSAIFVAFKSVCKEKGSRRVRKYKQTGTSRPTTDNSCAMLHDIGRHVFEVPLGL